MFRSRLLLRTAATGVVRLPSTVGAKASLVRLPIIASVARCDCMFWGPWVGRFAIPVQSFYSRNLASSSGHSKRDYPKFSLADLHEKARDVFADPRFYCSQEAATASFSVAARMEELGDITVKHLIDLWTGTTTQKRQVEKMIRNIGARVDAIESYLFDGRPIEWRLNGKIVALNGSDEIKLIKEQFVNVTTTRNLAATTKLTETRVEKIVYVYGASGTGKTFCAVKQVAPFESTGVRKSAEKSTTLYVKVSDLSSYKWDGKTADPEVLDWIETRLKSKYKRYNPEEKLRMNVSIVFDEVGSRSLSKFFEEKTKVTSLYNGIRSMVADGFNFRMVVCGTGLTGENLSSTEDVGKIRLTSWTKEDLMQVAEVRFPLLGVEAIEAIYRHPILNSLATNSRSAWFLLRAVQNVCLVDKEILNSIRGTWDDRLAACLPAIVGFVVDNYISKNGLRNLDPGDRCRVAARVFRAVEKARVRGQKEPPYRPSFHGLDLKCATVAESLITLNLDNSGSGMRLLKNEKFSIWVSPAITIVLFSVLRISATIVSDWTEYVSALYAFRQLVLDCVDQHLLAMEGLGKFIEGEEVPAHCAPALKNLLCELKLGLNESEETSPALEKQLAMVGLDPGLASERSCDGILEEKLLQLRLIQRNKSTPSPGSMTNFTVPRVGPGVVLNSFGAASFADVIAPYTLIQVKSRKGELQYELLEELMKCGLLDPAFVEHQPGTAIEKSTRAKESYSGWTVLTVLRWFWDGTIPVPPLTASMALPEPRETSEQQSSRAFPENSLLNGIISSGYDECYAEASVVNVDGRDWLQVDNAYCKLIPKDIEGRDIAFVAAYNVDKISIPTSLPTSLEIPRDFLTLDLRHFDEDGCVIEDRLKGVERENWEKIKRAIRTKLTVKFLRI
jgi:hypothetical protein